MRGILYPKDYSVFNRTRGSLTAEPSSDKHSKLLRQRRLFLMRTTLVTVIAIVGLLGAAAPLFSHHSFAAEFDANKPITLKGTVTKLEWVNPHSWLYIDVKDETGKVS